MKNNRNSLYHGATVYNGLKARNLTFKKVVKDVMRDRLNDRFMVHMENMVTRVVREEFSRLIQPYLSSSWAPIERSRPETPPSRLLFKLQFINSPQSSIFTGSKIEAEDGSPVAIELVEAATNARVVSGPLSFSRVEIVPLDADFTEESWTFEGFKRNILKQREAKPPLLTGDLTVTLKNGVGVIAGNVAFSDNSSWTRSGKFRLGGRLTGDEAVEARSEAFGCKDQRGGSYKKHKIPYPGDEVWRLKKIAKGGVSAKRLAEREIYTVKDFRRWYAIAPNALYNIFGGGISKKTWQVIVSHAMRCVLDETECYTYNANAHDVSLIFNSVYEVVGILSGGALQNPDQVPIYQLEQLKLEAYQNLNRFKAVNADHPQMSLQCPQDPRFAIVGSDSSMSRCVTGSGSTIQPEMLMSCENSPNATFHIDGNFLPTLRNRFRATEQSPVHGESETVVSRGNIEKNENENAFDYHHHHHHHDHDHDMYSNWSPGAVHWAEQAYDRLCVSVTGTEEVGIFDVRFANVNVGSPRGRWCKVKAALKLREVWRHTIARNRRKACKKPCLLY